MVTTQAERGEVADDAETEVATASPSCVLTNRAELDILTLAEEEVLVASALALLLESVAAPDLKSESAVTVVDSVNVESEPVL